MFRNADSGISFFFFSILNQHMVKQLSFIVLTVFFAWLFCLQAIAVPLPVVEAPSILVRNYTKDDYQASCQNWGAVVSPSGVLFVANNSGLLTFDGNSWNIFELSDQSSVYAVTIFRDTIFTGQNNDFGYWIIDDLGIPTYHSLHHLLPSSVSHSETFGQLYATDDILYIKSENYLFQYTTDGRLTPAVMHTGRDPFDQFENEQHYLLSKLPLPLQQELERSFVSDVVTIDTLLCIGTRYNGLFLVTPQGKILEHYSTRNQLQDNNIHSIYKQGDRRLWLLLDNGISLVSFQSPVTLLEDRREVGKLLDACSIADTLLLKTNQGVFKQVMDEDGRLKLAPYTALFPETNTEQRVLFNLPSSVTDTLPSFRKVMNENDQVVWGLQNGNKLSRIRLSETLGAIESVKEYVIPEGNNAEIVTDMSIIDDWVVLATNSGFYRYDKVCDCFVPHVQLNEQLDVYARGKLVFPVSTGLYWITLGNEAALFYILDGTAQLKCRIFFDNYNLSVVNREKRIISFSDSLHLVSAKQGVLLINTRRLIENNLAPNSFFRIMRIRYEDKNGLHYLPLTTKEVVLPFNFRNFIIQAGTSVFTPTHQISYMIEGISEKWSAWQNGGTISFLQLPEGSYTLKIRKYVVKGPFPEISLQIKVSSPWYDTMWAYIVYLLLLWVFVQGGLHYYLKTQRKKEQDLLETERLAEQQKLQQLKSEILETELQNKNNELTLQTSILVKKNQVMQALLDELESQKEVLGDRYPNKLYAKMKALITENLNGQADWLLFESYFNSAHQNFIERLRAQYSDLTVGDLRICCLLRMNLSTKEIASMLNISVRSVELRRYRLRKRLCMEAEDNLVDFLLSF